MAREKTTYLLYDKIHENYFLVKLTDEQMDAIGWFMVKAQIGRDYNWFAFSSDEIEEV